MPPRQAPVSPASAASTSPAAAAAGAASSGGAGRARQRRRTRKAIVDAAAALIARGQTPSMADVAAAADVSRRTVYLYFPTLEQLLLDATLGLLTERAVDQALDDGNADANADADPEARVERMLRTLGQLTAETLPLGRALIRLTVEAQPSAAAAAAGGAPQAAASAPGGTPRATGADADEAARAPGVARGQADEAARAPGVAPGEPDKAGGAPRATGATLEGAARAPRSPRRGYRRIAWIERALGPLRDRLDAVAYERLVSALALVIGWEAFIVLSDVRGVPATQQIEITTWAARALIRATLEEAQRAS